MPKSTQNYLQLEPSDSLAEFVDSYWLSENLSDEALSMEIVPDSFFKLVLMLVEGKIEIFYLTGLWPERKQVFIPAGASVFGIRFKILAPEYLFRREVSSLLQSHEDQPADFWDMDKVSFDGFSQVVRQWEEIMLGQLTPREKIPGKKLRLSQLLYEAKGAIQAQEVANQIGWSNRQINRYLNKYLGVSLKSYLNIQKCYTAFLQIREGRFFPDQGYFDQAHFIKEVKKHTHHTPGELYREQNDRFIQLKNIKGK